MERPASYGFGSGPSGALVTGGRPVAEAARLRLFGEFALEDVSGRPISLHLRKAEALLAYLALTPGQSASRETLAALLWGDSDQQRSRQSLRQVLFALTRAFAQLELPLLHVESQLVRLSDGAMAVDAVEFDRLLAKGSPDALREAGDLYTGEFLTGFGIEAPEFEDWLAATRDLYRDGAMRALCELLGQQERAHNLDQAVETAGRALRIEPLREDIHRHRDFTPSRVEIELRRIKKARSKRNRLSIK